MFHNFLNKIAIQKSDWTKALSLSKSLEIKNHCQISISTLLFVLQSVFFYNQLMSTKKQISSLFKLYSVYEEIPEEFLDETDVDSYFITAPWTFHSPATE